MKHKNNRGSKGQDGTKTKNKGESQQNQQQGALGVSKKGSGKHSKDESGGAEKNSTKKQENSI
jgi:hypothetical protein